MKTPKLKRRRVLFIIFGTLVVYFAVPFPFVGAQDRDSARECTIRWLLHHNDSAMQDKLQACFVGIGTTFDPKDGDFAPRDPPKEFLSRFSNFPVPIFPVSANTNRFSAADSTGKRGLLLAAGNVRRWSIGIVVCRGFYYEGGLSSAGYEVYLLRVPFAWIPMVARMLWIS